MRGHSLNITAAYQHVTHTEHVRHCKKKKEKKKDEEDSLSIKSVLSRDWCYVVKTKCCWRISHGKLSAQIYSLNQRVFFSYACRFFYTVE